MRHRDRLQPHHGLPRGLVPLAATALIAATGVSIVPAFVLALISLLIVPLALGLPERQGDAPRARALAGRARGNPFQSGWYRPIGRDGNEPERVGVVGPILPVGPGGTLARLRPRVVRSPAGLRVLLQPGRSNRSNSCGSCSASLPRRRGRRGWSVGESCGSTSRGSFPWGVARLRTDSVRSRPPQAGGLYLTRREEGWEMMAPRGEEAREISARVGGRHEGSRHEGGKTDVGENQSPPSGYPQRQRRAR